MYSMLSNKVKNIRYSHVGIMLFLAVLFWVGADLREFGADNDIPTNNVASYYFDKSQRLANDGVFPKEDIWDFAPTIHEENAPPFLAYFTAALYKPITLVTDADFYQFAHVFPIFIFGFWLISLFFVFRDFFGVRTALAGAALFSFLPVSVSLTTRGIYTQETLGTWLLFLSVYFLIKLTQETAVRGNKFFLWGGMLVITMLVLTWQQFVIFYGAAALVVFYLFLTKHQYFRNIIARWSVVLLVPLIAGEMISQLFIGIDYSPFGMIGEFFFGLLHYNNPDLILAMSRSDWLNLTWGAFYDHFGILGILLGALGLAAVLFDRKNLKKVLIGFFSIVGFGMLMFFEKDRFFALSLLLYLFALGLVTLFEPQTLIHRVKYVAVFCKNYLKNIKFSQKYIIISLALIGIIVLAGVFERFYASPPIPNISISNFNGEVGESERVIVELKNNGGRPITNKNAFGGLHIEVQNALVSDVTAFSSSTKSRVSFKNFASVGNIFFFETKYDYVHSGESGIVSFTITPYAKPVKIYYRGWLPGRCSLEDQQDALEDLLPEWQDLGRAGWRSENCIQRSPAYTDTKESACRVPVFAAHKELQDFRCFVH